jgi:DNA processing protein
MDDTRVGEAERVALVALLEEVASAAGEPRRRYTAWSAIASEVMRRSAATTVWDERHPLTLEGAGETDAALMRARDRLARWDTADFGVVTVLERGYPLRLRQVEQIPSVLFVKGELRVDELAVSVVGSRQASARGHELAADIAAGLVERGLSVVSGLATGVDTAAHQATLAAGGRPIGVLGTGITGVNPEGNRCLHDRVAAAGAFVSQFWADCPPDKHTFLLRNATMAGLSRASVIVEAGERSGSRVHARYALCYGRPLIVTDLVATSTRWGREMSHRAGVYVASSTAEVRRVVDEVMCDADIDA